MAPASISLGAAHAMPHAVSDPILLKHEPEQPQAILSRSPSLATPPPPPLTSALSAASASNAGPSRLSPSSQAPVPSAKPSLNGSSEGPSQGPPGSAMPSGAPGPVVQGPGPGAPPPPPPPPGGPPGLPPAPVIAARFAQALAADHEASLRPDYRTPFRSAEDVVRRLLPYHVWNAPDEDLWWAMQGEEAQWVPGTGARALQRSKKRKRGGDAMAIEGCNVKKEKGDGRDAVREDGVDVKQEPAADDDGLSPLEPERRPYRPPFPVFPPAFPLLSDMERIMPRYAALRSRAAELRRNLSGGKSRAGPGGLEALISMESAALELEREEYNLEVERLKEAMNQAYEMGVDVDEVLPTRAPARAPQPNVEESDEEESSDEEEEEEESEEEDSEEDDDEEEADESTKSAAAAAAVSGAQPVRPPPPMGVPHPQQMTQAPLHIQMPPHVQPRPALTSPAGPFPSVPGAYRPPQAGSIPSTPSTPAGPGPAKKPRARPRKPTGPISASPAPVSGSSTPSTMPAVAAAAANASPSMARPTSGPSQRPRPAQSTPGASSARNSPTATRPSGAATDVPSNPIPLAIPLAALSRLSALGISPIPAAHLRPIIDEQQRRGQGLQFGGANAALMAPRPPPADQSEPALLMGFSESLQPRPPPPASATSLGPTMNQRPAPPQQVQMLHISVLLKKLRPEQLAGLAHLMQDLQPGLQSTKTGGAGAPGSPSGARPSPAPSRPQQGAPASAGSRPTGAASGSPATRPSAQLPQARPAAQPPRPQQAPPQ